MIKVEQIDLSGFTGTESYHKISLGNMVATDGFAYLCNEAKCFWLSDIVCSVQHLPKVKENQRFLIWRIVKKEDGCVVSAYWDSNEDGSFSDKTLVYTQEVEYTDFPFEQLGNEFEFYQVNDVVMLKSEY